MSVQSTSDDQEHSHQETTDMDQDLLGPQTTTGIPVKQIADYSTQRSTNEVLCSENGSPVSDTALAEVWEVLQLLICI
jgi:hypothetical protein